MPIKEITIDNILNGWATSDYITRTGQFLSSIGIDPDMPSDDSGNKPSGLIRPTSLAKFSGSNVDSSPMWFLTNPKNNKIYAVLYNGKFISYTSSYGTETLISTLATCSGNGAAYYDNALYIARDTDIAKYTPLDGTPSLTASYWVGSLSKTALSDTTYPSINGVEMPNHVMHRHTDDKLYIADVASNKGVLHYIKTSKTTNEGDTDDGSTYNALDFDYGEYPTAIETYQSDLVVGLIEGTDTTVRQKPAKLSFWDTTSASYSSITSVELADPLITAIRNVNGILYVLSGNAAGGCRVSRIISGYRIEEVAYLPEVYPPLGGAIDHLLNRVIFGANTTEPEASGSVFAIGAKEANFPLGVHNIARLPLTGSDPQVTAVKYTTQNGAIPPIMVGGKDDTPAYQIAKYSTTYGDYNVWRSDVFIVDSKFIIKEVRIPLAQAVGANMTMTVKIYGDDATTTPSVADKTLLTINNTNYPNSERVIKYYPSGKYNNNFFIQLEWSGSALLTVALPITIIIETIQ